ncbi:hypothetical protein CHS0354_027431 [Potamilus streckersoni]|uniref:RING-type domain-containing protein n=1 Tax=Potamilus streckersoni TaxID=2493646 RepID=A0AAE0VNE6_9BIVA|nr:hypothetical protein CHS0354_027431 [Potamilus streckersoni]
MAVSKEHLQCSICRQLFKKPRTLMPCLHTFCEVCLYGYIMDQVAHGQVNAGFKCPFCTAFVVEPASDKSPDEWATIFPLNHLIVSLLDTFKNQNSGEYFKTEIDKSNREQYHLNSNSEQSKVWDSDKMIRNEVLKPVISRQNMNTTRNNSKQENRSETGSFLTRSMEHTYVNLKIEVGRGDNNVSVCFNDSDYSKLAQATFVVPDFSDEFDYVHLRNDVNPTNFFNKESYVPDKIMTSDSDVLLPPPPPPCGSRPSTVQGHVSPVKTSSKQQPLNCSSTTHHTPWHHPVKSHLQYGSQQPQTGATSYRPTGYSILYGDF